MNNRRSIAIRVACFFLFAAQSVVFAQSSVLAYKFLEGGVDRYRETSRTIVSAEKMPGGKQIFVNETYSTQRVEKVNSDGSAELLRRIDSTTSSMNDRLFQNPAARGVDGFSLRVKMSSRGNVLEVRSVKDSLNEMERGVLEAFRGQLMSQPGFPSSPVKVGDRWQDSTTLTQQTPVGSLTTQFNFSTVLDGYDTLSSVVVSVLKLSVKLGGTIAGGAGSIRGAGGGTIYFSTGLGKELKSELTIDQAMEVTSTQGSTTMNMKTSTTRELIH